MFDLAVLPLMPSLKQTQSGFAPLAGIEPANVLTTILCVHMSNT